MNEADAKRAIDGVAAETRALVAGMIVELTTGRVIAVWSRNESFDAALASVYQSESLRHQQRAAGVLNVSAKIEDVLVTSDEQLHLIRLLGEQHFVYLVTERAGTNLALLRACLQRHVDTLVPSTG